VHLPITKNGPAATSCQSGFAEARAEIHSDSSSVAARLGTSM
jgi:hypothetical protein